MSVQSIYKSYLYNKFLQEQEKQGESVTSTEAEKYLRENVDGFDLSVPQFDSKFFKVARGEESSASKMNATLEALKQDLAVAYQAFFSFGRATGEDYERWKRQIEILEKRLSDLEDRIDNLLLIAQDTEGYHSYFLDNFTDLFSVDLANTTVAVDTASQLAFISPYLSGGQTTTKLTLDIPLENVNRKIRTGTASLRDERGLRNAPFDGNLDTEWWLQVRDTVGESVTVEYIVKLSDNPVYLSSIYIHPHHGGGQVSITPLLSTDGYNYSQVPGQPYTQQVEGQATFDFRSTLVQWVKFILVREHPNDVDEKLYEFGFDEIEFYDEAFTTGESESLISNPISVTDPQGNIVEFSKIALNACESTPPNTSITYYLTPGGSADFSVDGTTKWYPISPIGRSEPQHPKVLNLGDIVEVEIGDTETVQVSHDSSASDGDYINPAQSFRLLSLDTDDSILDEAIQANAVRYLPAKNNERILNYQVKDSSYSGSGTGTALEMDEDSVRIFRNIGEKGAVNTVRGVARGWRFENPYYITLIEVLSEDLEINFGAREVIIDNKAETGTIEIKAKTATFDGVHEVRVHKDNWRQVTPGLNTLSELISADPLYPHNHKLLIEGYDYGDSWLNTTDQVYQGADIFFERRMKQITPYDLSESLGDSNKYKYFALDRDIASTHTGGNSATRVFTVKIDETNPDYINERFNIRFNLVNQRYSYVRFRADLLTNDEANSPVLGPYQLKFGD